MHVAHVFADQVKRVDGIGFAVQDKICGVEIDSKIVKSRVLDHAKQGDGGFLSRFKEKILSVLLAIRADVLDRRDQIGIALGGRAFG